MKQVIVVNEALRLPRGKLAAQVAHAAVAALLEASPDSQRRWFMEGMPKVVLRVDGEAELLALEAEGIKAGLPTALIRDAGRTVIAPDTPTCVGLGPADIEALDAVTGTLRLV
jgi:peptidyl-tRNA hydrolase